MKKNKIKPFSLLVSSIILLFGLTFVSYRVVSVSAQTIDPIEWSRMNFSGQNITSIVVDPSDPQKIYVASSTVGFGVFKTEDGGISWSEIKTGLPGNVAVAALAIDHQNPQVLYAGTLEVGTSLDGRIYKTTSGGDSWTQVKTGVNLVDVAVDPFNSDVVYAIEGYMYAGDYGILKSSNGGANWSSRNAGITGNVPSTLTVDPTNGQIVYAVGRDVYRSSNGADNWTPINNGFTVSHSFSTVAVNPLDNKTLYTGSKLYARGMYTSTNSGDLWNLTSDGIEDLWITDIVLEPNKPDVIYISTQKPVSGGTIGTGVFRSTDGAASWTPKNEGFPSDLSSLFISVLAVIPGDPGSLLAGTTDGLWVRSLRGFEPTYSISGTVTDANLSPIPEVTISSSFGETTSTDVSGVYTITTLISGTYTLTPTKNEFFFSPFTRTVTGPPDVTNVNFIGTKCSPDKWLGQYYNNRDLQGIPALTRCDEQIDFYWGKQSPHTTVLTDNFSIRWEKTITITQNGWYHFRAFTDDGLRLYVDGERIIDDWSPRSFTEKSALKKLSPGSYQVIMEYVEWSDDAMVYLNWYRSLLCPETAIDCQFNITPMYQTQYLDKPMPEGCTTESNQTIARWGCLITSYAMALQTLGVNTDPDQLNHLLSDANGYRSGACDGNLNLGDVTSVVSKTYGVTLKYTHVQTLDSAKTALRNGQPVVMKYSFDHDNQHFFLAVDISELNGQEYLGIIDPHHAWACSAVPAGSPPPVRSYLQCYGSSLQHVTTTEERFANSVPYYYLEATAQSQTPILQLSARGAEVLVFDQQGRRVGFEPIAGQVVYEIPDSLYYDAEIVPPGGQSDGILQRNLFIPRTPRGSYSLELVKPLGLQAQATTDFEIIITGFDNSFEVMETKVSGQIGSGEVIAYEIRFDPEQGIVSVSERTKIYLPIILK